MAITTTNGKLAIMELDSVWEPGLPLSPGAFDQADQQQLLWGFPEILWTEGIPNGVLAIDDGSVRALNDKSVELSTGNKSVVLTSGPKTVRRLQ